MNGLLSRMILTINNISHNFSHLIIIYEYVENKFFISLSNSVCLAHVRVKRVIVSNGY